MKILLYVCSHLWSTHNEWEHMADRQCILQTVRCFPDNIKSSFAVLLFMFFFEQFGVSTAVLFFSGSRKSQQLGEDVPDETFITWKIK